MSVDERQEDSSPWRAVVAGFDARSRRSVTEALRRGGIVVVAEAVDENDAVALTRYFAPDVLVLDAAGSGPRAISATRRITEQRAEQVVILLTDPAEQHLGMLALRVGASGYLRKDVDGPALTRAILGVLHGEAAIPRGTTMQLLEYLRDATEAGRHAWRPLRTSLTRRQWEVLDLVCEGRTTGEIAASLDVSAETVRSHVKSIFRRLGVHSREEAAAAALELKNLNT